MLAELEWPNDEVKKGLALAGGGYNIGEACGVVQQQLQQEQ